jgi:hypothetical protein
MKCLPSPYSYSKAGEERALHLSQVVFVRVGSRKEKVIYSRKKGNPIATDMFRCRVITHAEKKKK